MIIRCVKCNEFVTIPEDVLKSGKLQFICHLCNTAQEIKTVRIMQEKAGKLSVSYAERHIADHDLFVGINTVGRTSEEKKSDIEFSEDEYLGRQHFIIEVRKNDRHGNFEYLVYYKKIPRNKTTIISGREKRELKPSEKIILFNKDKIVAGKTTFHLTTENIPDQVGSTGTVLVK